MSNGPPRRKMKANATRVATTVRIMRQSSVVSCPLSLVLGHLSLVLCHLSFFVGHCYWNEEQGACYRTRDKGQGTSDVYCSVLPSSQPSRTDRCSALAPGISATL